MDRNLRVSATVICNNFRDQNIEDFYFNGDLPNYYLTQSVQCSLKKAADNFVFAISDSMGNGCTEYENAPSAIKEVKNIHNSLKKTGFAIELITDKLYEAIQLSSNLIYSKSIIDNHGEQVQTSFSSLVIERNKASVMNLGNNSVFVFRQGMHRDVFSNESKKAEKLKMLGISTSTQNVSMLSSNEKMLRLAEEESKTKLKLSPYFDIVPGDIVVLCSATILKCISKSKIESMIDNTMDAGFIASALIQEAQRVNGNLNYTVLAIKVDEGNEAYSSIPQGNDYDLDENYEEEKDSSVMGKVVNYIVAFVSIVVIAGVVFMGWLIFRDTNISGNQKEPANSTIAASASSSTQLNNSDSSDNSTLPQQGDDSQQGSDVNNDGQNQTPQNNEQTQNPIQGNEQQQNQQQNQQPPNQQQTGNESSNEEYDTYVVKSGDTLSAISYKYYKSYNKYDVIMKYNNIKNESSLVVDQVLRIPKLPN